MNSYLKVQFRGTFNQSQLSGLKKNKPGLFFSQFKPVHAIIQVRKVPVPVQEKERGTHSWELNA